MTLNKKDRGDCMKPTVLLKATKLLSLIGVFSTAVIVPSAHTEQIWTFAAGASVTVVEPINDLSDPPNGGQDLIVGSEDDTLYLVEARGAKAGGELWRVPMKSTVTSIKSINDVDGDGRADLIAGDMADIVYCISGGSGTVRWKYLTRGSILSIVEVPDVDGDKKSDVVVCSEDNFTYCFSGVVNGMNNSTQLGNILWKFNTDSSSINPKHLTKSTLSTSSLERPQGANTVALIRGSGVSQFPAVAVGTSSDSVFCLSVAGQNGNPVVLWRISLPGDVWNLNSCSDVDGDNVEDLIVACGADISYFISGKTGAELSACKAQGGAQVTLAPGDLNKDGIADGIIGDGFGNVQCVSGAARGKNAKELWTFSIGAHGTIKSLALAGDLNKNGLPEIIIGSTNDSLYVCTDAGQQFWAMNMSGTVYSVAGIADVNGDGKIDIAAGTENSIAAVFSALTQTPNSYPRTSSMHYNESISRSGVLSDLLGRCIPIRNQYTGDINFLQSNSGTLTSGMYLIKDTDMQYTQTRSIVPVVK
jgi:hypothetical protein